MGQFTRVGSGGRVLRGGATRSIVSDVSPGHAGRRAWTRTSESSQPAAQTSCPEPARLSWSPPLCLRSLRCICHMGRGNSLLPGESVSRGFADRGALEGYPSHYTSLVACYRVRPDWTRLEKLWTDVLVDKNMLNQLNDKVNDMKIQIIIGHSVKFRNKIHLIQYICQQLTRELTPGGWGWGMGRCECVCVILWKILTGLCGPCFRNHTLGYGDRGPKSYPSLAMESGSKSNPWQ